MIRNRQINELVRDLTLDVTVDDLVRHPWDRDKVHTVFDGLEFRVLRERLVAEHGDGTTRTSRRASTSTGRSSPPARWPAG